MNYKVLFVGLSLSILVVIFYFGSKYNVHHEILRRACPYSVSTCICPFTNTTNVPYLETSTKYPCVCPSKKPNIDAAPYIETKKEISRKLAGIYQELKTAASHKLPPTPKLLLELKGIIGELDPAHRLSQDDKEPVEPKTVNTSVLLDVCPEKYMGEKFGYPFYQKGWELQKCTNVKPLNKVVSIVVNTMQYPEPMEKQVDTVLKGINQTYPQVKVFLAAKTSQIKETAKKYPNIKTIAVNQGSSLGKVWNQLINEVSTPYTLVARDVVHFTWLTRIERQIHMISTTEHVAIAGGSFRNLTGHWRVGCRQTKLFNYVLQYEEGYHYSRHSCMFCDDLEGPFVAQTNLLKGLKFNEKYSKEILFEEFFLRVFQSGNLIMNCPDAMYFTTDYSTETKQNSKAIWRPLATDLKLVRVVLVDYGVRHKFSCGEISYKCTVSVTKYVALPMCCLEQFGKAMKFFQDLSIKNNLHFELDTGSILAAAKFNNYNPFDIDGDAILVSQDFPTLYKQASLVSQHGFSLSSYQTSGAGYLSFNTPEINVEVWGIGTTTASKFSPPDLQKLPYYTKCRVNNYWINCAYYPVLYARNRYGPDVLKHSQSWRHVDKKNSFDRYTPGSFVKCNDPSFHACLDKFPGDGNIAFKVF